MVHLEVANATFTYPEAKTPSLNNVSFQITEGSFTLLCGPSGCGKTTLLRLLKPEMRPYGSSSGTVLYYGTELNEDDSLDIGLISQDPDHQIVMEEVQNELSFGMENIGLSSAIMRKRLAEIVQFFDIEPLLHRKTSHLSGGEKQLLNLASILLMQPKVLLLDEPTSQLDPIASKQLLQMLERLNQEWGITIVLAEHQVDELFSVVDQVVFLEAGYIRYLGTPSQVVEQLYESQKEMHSFIPMVPKMFLSLEKEVTSSLPLSVKQGRRGLLDIGDNLLFKRNSIHDKCEELNHCLLVELKEIYLRYQYAGEDVLKHLNLGIKSGEALCILGRNGSGKSTILQIIAEQLIPQRGKVIWHQKPRVAYLPQNPKALFIHDCLELEINSLAFSYSLSKNEINHIISELQISHLLQQHPHDLSEGELQRAALALLLCTKPQLLLLDEPTRGLDPLAKDKLLQFLQHLQRDGVTIVLVTHDVEFANEFATRCALLFQGEITAISDANAFFSGSFFYTTILRRVLRNTPWSHISTLKEFLEQCPGHSI